MKRTTDSARLMAGMAVRWAISQIDSNERAVLLRLADSAGAGAVEEFLRFEKPPAEPRRVAMAVNDDVDWENWKDDETERYYTLEGVIYSQWGWMRDNTTTDKESELIDTLQPVMCAVGLALAILMNDTDATIYERMP